MKVLAADAVLDLKKIDVGVPDFGPVCLVFNRSKLDDALLFMPADTGQWSGSCNLTNQGRHCPSHTTASDCGTNPLFLIGDPKHFWLNFATSSSFSCCLKLRGLF